MNYHNIKHDDLLNGDGMRVTLFVSGCSHHCKNCQNPLTWDEKDGLPFTQVELEELDEQLSKPYIAGITFSGGDPLYINNREEVLGIIRWVSAFYGQKTIWLYTGYTYEELVEMHDKTIDEILNTVDVLVDGKYVEELRDTVLHWRGSKNQRVIDLIKTRQQKKIVERD